MNFVADNGVLIVGIGCLLTGGAAAIFLIRWKEKSTHKAILDQEQAILVNARREADSVVREARLGAHEEALKQRNLNEEAMAVRRLELTNVEAQLARRETQVVEQNEALTLKDKDLREQQRQCQQKG